MAVRNGPVVLVVICSFLVLALLAAQLVVGDTYVVPQNCGSANVGQLLRLQSCLQYVRNQVNYVSQTCCQQAEYFAPDPKELCCMLITAQVVYKDIDIQRAVDVPMACNAGDKVPKGFYCNGWKVPSNP
ncbi:hypothetical protein O6H91_10G045900 [Diphasiastrum complanatum]|uniref:Uncharacterized protein n=1 Tax=Diphasiastrum complanatum TaxID=34168 RepID=A0ACC2CGG9_DIPCM|nr:hypothetical protein O6H91_10G045900 [Diphasiastrum complanatum]